MRPAGWRAPGPRDDDAPAAGARASEHIAAASAATLLDSQSPSRGRRDDVRHVSAALGCWRACQADVV
jgi:hypothetical protein